MSGGLWTSEEDEDEEEDEDSSEPVFLSPDTLSACRWNRCSFVGAGASASAFVFWVLGLGWTWGRANQCQKDLGDDAGAYDCAEFVGFLVLGTLFSLSVCWVAGTGVLLCNCTNFFQDLAMRQRRKLRRQRNKEIRQRMAEESTSL